MLFRSALFLSALQPFGAAASLAKPSASVRRLQATDLGDYEIGTPEIYYNDGTDGTGLPAPGIVNPTIVITFEHDDVEHAAGDGSAAYGTRKITHYEGGCTQEIVAPFGSSAIGEMVMDASANLLMAQTGLDVDITQTIVDSVQTSIRYPMELLDANTDITEEVLGTVTTKFCTRLSLLDDDGDEFGFRELDLTITHSKNTLADLNLDTTEEDTEGDINEPLADYEVGAFFCDSTGVSLVAPAAAAAPTPAPGPSTQLNQGEDFTICLQPQDGAGVAVSDVDIVEVEDCVFWIDVNPNSLIDNGETSVVAFENNAPVDTVATNFQLGDGYVALATTGVTGAYFTITLPPAFFVSATTNNVLGRCTVLMEFQGVLRRRELQVNGDQTEATSEPVALKINNGFVEETTDDSCTAGCFFIFCLFRFIICFFQGIFGF